MKKEKVILGIDPGTNVMGFGVIRSKGKALEVLDLGVVKLSKEKEHTMKLKHIFEQTVDLMKKHLPDEMAVEAPFFGKNVQSMLKLGRAQGVIMAAALSRNIPIIEYAPRKVKQSITGNGNAEKEQVASMLEQSFNTQLDAQYMDATDGLAVAVCHHYQQSTRFPSGSKSWKQFLKDNPGKVSED